MRLTYDQIPDILADPGVWIILGFMLGNLTYYGIAWFQTIKDKI